MLMRYSLILFVLLLGFPGAAQEAPPYIYYYSFQHNAFIVERADGTEVRAFGTVPHAGPLSRIEGPGWSPDGQWFAYSWVPSEFYNGAYIHMLTNSVIELDGLFFIGQMAWSPDSSKLLVSGTMDMCFRACNDLSNWLLQVDPFQQIDSYRFVATLQFLMGDLWGGLTNIQWSNDSVSYNMNESALGPADSWVFRIAMHFDGTVVKMPIDSDVYMATFPQQPEEAPNRFSSPSERYEVTSGGTLTDTTTGAMHTFPPPDFGDMFEDDYWTIEEVTWHDSEDWMMLFYRYMQFGDPGPAFAMVVANTDGSVYRELSTCGDAPACVGWLPDNVDVGLLPVMK